MEEFNRREKTGFDAKIASIGALDAVKQQKARVCPLVCGNGFRAEEDHCVAEACRRGMSRNKVTGECERPPKATVAPPAAREEAGGGQIYCNRAGCNSVPKNCRIGSGQATNQGSNIGGTVSQTLVCN